MVGSERPDQQELARPEGFEPPTLCLEGRRSFQLSYGRDVEFNNIIEFHASAPRSLGMPLASGQNCASIKILGRNPATLLLITRLNKPNRRGMKNYGTTLTGARQNATFCPVGSKTET